VLIVREIRGDQIRGDHILIPLLTERGGRIPHAPSVWSQAETARTAMARDLLISLLIPTVRTWLGTRSPRIANARSRNRQPPCTGSGVRIRFATKRRGFRCDRSRGTDFRRLSPISVVDGSAALRGSERRGNMTKEERRSVTLCILSLMCERGYSNAPARPVMDMLDALDDDQLVAFH
jgi:hypothetical protein